MTTKAGAIYSFLSGFGMEAYVAPPSDAEYPYITYDLVDGAFGDGEVNMTVNLWYKTTSEAVPNAKVNEISKAIGRGGKLIACDEGALWIKRGSPFAQSVNAEDESIKQRYINIDIEFLTED